MFHLSHRSWIGAVTLAGGIGLIAVLNGPVRAGEPTACATPEPYGGGWVIVGTDAQGCTIVENFEPPGGGPALPNTALPTS